MPAILPISRTCNKAATNPNSFEGCYAAGSKVIDPLYKQVTTLKLLCDNSLATAG
jgi:hypothetical protein